MKRRDTDENLLRNALKRLDQALKDPNEKPGTGESIHDSEALYRLFFQNSVAGTFRSIYDPAQMDGWRIDCNEAYARILGHDKRKDALGQSLRYEFHSDHDLKAYIHDLLEHKSVSNYQLLLKRKNGEPIWILLNANLREFKNGLMMVEGTAIDITDRVMAEAKLVETNQQLRSLTSELIMTEERERRRIALDLHDNIGQSLAVCKMKIESLLSGTSGSDSAQYLAEIEDMINQSIQHTRSLMTDLSPSVLYELGFPEAIEWLSEQIHNQYGLQIAVRNNMKNRKIDQELQVFLFRATKELLLNSTKHAGAKKAYITLHDDGQNLQINVRDNGQSSDITRLAETSRDDGRSGLFSIRERLHYFGGSLEVETGEKGGASFTLVAPRKIRIKKHGEAGNEHTSPSGR